MRIGFGYDSHRFEEGRKLVLGGIEFPGETGLKGHSDADVLLHAIIDALLPDTDPKWRDADSAKLLEAVVAEVLGAGFTIGNVDATVICERPKLRPKIDAIRGRLSGLLGIPVGSISVKGKTNEKMDDVGAGVGIEVHAVCLLEEN